MEELIVNKENREAENLMTFDELLKNRRSVRKYQDKPVVLVPKLCLGTDIVKLRFI